MRLDKNSRGKWSKWEEGEMRRNQWGGEEKKPVRRRIKLWSLKSFQTWTLRKEDGAMKKRSNKRIPKKRKDQFSHSVSDQCWHLKALTKAKAIQISLHFSKSNKLFLFVIKTCRMQTFKVFVSVILVVVYKLCSSY